MTTTSKVHQSHRATPSRDEGFTIVEILIVIVILAILSTVVVFAIRGVTDRGEESACGSDVRTMSTAAEAYMAENGVDTLPATGADDDRFEQTLIDDGYLKDVSTYYDLNADGTVSTNGVPCA